MDRLTKIAHFLPFSIRWLVAKLGRYYVKEIVRLHSVPVVDADFWHLVESNSHQHRCSKFLMKSRIIWSNYDHDQKSMLHLVACNRNQRFTLHVISCCISRHFMSHFMSHCMHFTHIVHFIHCMHITSFYVSFHVILSWKFIAWSFIPFSIEERRNRVQMPSSSIEHHLSGAF